MRYFSHHSREELGERLILAERRRQSDLRDAAYIAENHPEMVNDPSRIRTSEFIAASLAEEAAEITDEIELRDLALAAPLQPKGTTVRVIEDIDDHCSAPGPKRGFEGRVLQHRDNGTTLVRFKPKLFGYMGNKSLDLYIPNHALEAA